MLYYVYVANHFKNIFKINHMKGKMFSHQLN